MEVILEEFIRKKIDEAWIKFEIAEVDCKDFIYSLVEEMPVKKAYVDKKFVEKWRQVFLYMPMHLREKGLFKAIKQMLREVNTEINVV